MRTLKGLAIGVTLLCMFWAMPAHATVDWNEGFEYANQAALEAVWASSCVGDPRFNYVSTLNVVTGTHSFGQTLFDGVGSCFMDRQHTATKSVWMRFYITLVNFTPSAQTQTKFFYNKSFPGGTYAEWHTGFSSRELYPIIFTASPGVFCTRTQRIDVACEFFPNAASIPLQNNIRYCIETHADAGTAGNADGTLELFINGTKTLGYTNIPMVPAGVSAATSQYRLITHYAQYGSGNRYWDDFAVGDTRIGCSGSPAPAADNTAPGPPKNLTAR